MIEQDVNAMHAKFGVHTWFEENKGDKALMLDYLKFRLGMCQEEVDETIEAIEQKDADGVVDGLIDLIVFASGTLNILGVDIEKAWKEVHGANMVKSPGVKPGRPNPFGLPDLIKPEGWQAPSHLDNVGALDEIFSEE